MTRREAVARAGVVVLASAGAVALLWSAWRVLTTPLPDAAATAAWTLWVLAVAALVTFVLYLLELVRHGLATRRAGWKPLPSLALLWVAGLTAVLTFGFVLPDRPGESTRPDVDSAAPSPSPTATATPAPTTSATTSASPPPDARTARPAAVPVRATPGPQSVSTPSVTRTATRTATPSPSTTTARPTPSSSTTTRPLLDIVLPPQGRRPTSPPPSR